MCRLSIPSVDLGHISAGARTPGPVARPLAESLQVTLILNIELGLLVRDPSLASDVVLPDQFDLQT